MGFADRLRMNGIYNTGGSMFTPLHGADRDPLEEILSYFNSQGRSNSMDGVNPVIPRGINQAIRPQHITPNSSPNSGQLQFGGEVSPVSNPGADILNRAKIHGENLYKSYNEPPVNAGELLAHAGIKPNEQFPTERADFILKHENNDLAERKVADLEQRTRIAAYKAQNPNKQLKVIDGALYAVDPTTGHVEDTGVKGISKEHQLEIELNNAKDLENLREKGREKIQGMKNDAKGNGEQKPLDRSREIANRAHKFKIDYPGLSQYITIDGNNINVDDSISDTDYEKLRKALYPENYTNSTSNNKPDNKPISAPSSTNDVDPNARIRVKAPDGRTGTLPANKPLPQGYVKY